MSYEWISISGIRPHTDFPVVGSYSRVGISSVVQVGSNSVSVLRRVEHDGASDPPSLQMSYGRWPIDWPVDPGLRTFQIQCKHSGLVPVPRVVIQANPDLGVFSDVVAEAQNITDWHTISVSVYVLKRGVLKVWLEHRDPSINSHKWVRWDDIVVS